jgi:hypothetical protein
MRSLQKLNLIGSTDEFNCTACRLGDAKKQVSRIPQARTTTPFDLIHIDVIGPITPTGYNHHRWGITFVEDCTRYRWFYLMAIKGGAA